MGYLTAVHSAGFVSGATGAISDEVNATAVRNGLGDYTITLPDTLPINQRAVLLTVVDSAGVATRMTAGEGADTLNVNTGDMAGAAADRDFTFVVLRTGMPMGPPPT